MSLLYKKCAFPTTRTNKTGFAGTKKTGLTGMQAIFLNRFLRIVVHGFSALLALTLPLDIVTPIKSLV